MVGENVRRLRLASDLSQEMLAERMGVDRAYISGLEVGRRNPTVITLWHAAEALDVPTFKLLEEVRPSTGPEPATGSGHPACASGRPDQDARDHIQPASGSRRMIMPLLPRWGEVETVHRAGSLAM